MSRCQEWSAIAAGDVLDMLDQGDLGQVIAGTGLARRLIDAAHRHVKSAEILVDGDPDAGRKAMTAIPS